MTDIKVGHTGALRSGAESTSGYVLGDAQFEVIRPRGYAEFDAKVLSGPRGGYIHTINVSMVTHWDHHGSPDPQHSTSWIVVGETYDLIPGAVNIYGSQLGASRATIRRGWSDGQFVAAPVDGEYAGVEKIITVGMFYVRPAQASSTYARPVVPTDTDSVDVFDMLTTMGG